MSGKKGVFSFQELKRAVADGVISASTPIGDKQIQPASMDLRLGDKAYALVSSFLPEKNTKIADILDDSEKSDLVKYEFKLREEGSILDKGIIYLIPLMEALDLPADVDGKTNPKSTTGRLDIFTRVLTDSNPVFDHIKEGYKGGLYVEVMPRSFSVKVTPGMSLGQLRLRRGNCYIIDDDLKKIYNEDKLLYVGDECVPRGDVRFSHGIFMSVDLKGNGVGVIGYKAKKNSNVIDLSKIDHHREEDFWEKIPPNPKNNLILEPEEFYILASREKIRIPNNYAADMAPFDAGAGELRTHYAGFFDPGFGYGEGGEMKGTKAVLEVRAHDVPFMITHGQTFCKLYFEEMGQIPEAVYGPKIGSSYQGQGIKLSKQFKQSPQP